MRLHSTPDSAVNLVITKLAIIETIVSIAIYTFICIRFETFLYLGTAILLAPLMLFRTDESTHWALETSKKIFSRYFELGERIIVNFFEWFLLISIYAIIYPITGILLRIFSTLYFFIKNPLTAFRMMSQNWLRQCLCTDLFHPPEIIPTESTKIRNQTGLITFIEIISIFKAKNMQLPSFISFKTFAGIIVIPVLLIGWIPSIIYRITFKATSIVYLPFIWSAKFIVENRLPIKERLERYKIGELEKVRRYYSGVILFIGLTKIAFLKGIVDYTFLAKNYINDKIINKFIVLDSWPLWQITLLIDALLTFLLLIYVDNALPRLSIWKKKNILGIISTISFLRAGISIITIVILCYYVIKYIFFK